MQFETPKGRRPGRRLSRLPLLLLAVPLLVGLFATPVQVATGDELADAQAAQKALAAKIAKQKALVAEINSAQAELRGDIASTNSQLRGIAQDLSVVRAKVKSLTAQIAKVRAKYNDLVADMHDMDAQLVQITAEEATKKQEYGKRRDELAQRIREAYEADRTSLLETVLSNSSFADVLAEMSAQLDVAEQDRALARQIQQDREALASLHQTVELTREQTLSLRQEVAVQKQQLDLRMAELKAAQARLKQLEAETKRVLATQKKAYAKLQRDKAHLRRAIAEAAAARRKLQSKINRIIAEQYQHGNIPSQYNGTLHWPMPGIVSQNFGCTGVVWEPPLGSCSHWHNGIDIVAPYGTPVRASGAGRVVYIGWNYADGPDPAWIVVVAHSQSLQTWYAHMQPRYPGGIRAGSAVAAGQVIGYEGNTGHSTGAHLHWMVEFNGSFVNPRLFT